MSKENLISGPNNGKQRPKFVPQPLNIEQINMAKEAIKENHPLLETPFHKVFPALKPVAKIFKKKQVESELPFLDEESNKGGVINPSFQRRKSSRRLKQPKLSAQLQSDPYNFLGFGMVVYRDLMFTLIMLFLVMSVLFIPAMVIYGQHEGYNALGQKPSYAKLSLGNMGQSSIQCTQFPFALGKVEMACPYGSFGQLKHFGINPEGSERTACRPIPKYENQTICDKKINLHFKEYLQTAGTQPRTNDTVNGFSFTTKPGKETSIFIDEFVPDMCTNSNAFIYVQYTCIQTKEERLHKHRQASIIAICGVFAVLIYLITLYYFKKVSKLKQLEWDASTITPGDYTMQMEITDQAYDWFIRNVYPQDEVQGISIGASMKTFMKSQLEKILTEKLREIKASGSESSSIKITEVKIADIVFAFNNADLIALLRKRGLAIMYQKFDEMRKIENQISALKDQKFAELTKPVDAFITFEEEDGAIIAQEFEPEYTLTGQRKPAKMQFMGDDLIMVESTEPTNIIWENRHYTTTDYIKRTFVALIIIGILLAASFGIIFWFKSYAMMQTKKYPNVACNGFINVYGDKLGDFALKEYQDFKNGIPQAGTLKCFCEKKANIDKLGKGTILMDYFLPDDPNKTQLCREYVVDSYLALGYNQGVSYMIICVNYILRLLIIKVIIFIGRDTESEQTKLITNGVFIVQFFNTALLLLSVNANLAEQSTFLGYIFGRGLADFTPQWYLDIGNTLVYAMIFNVAWPLIEFVSFFCLRTVFRLIDKRLNCRTDRTHKTTIQQYIEVYSGPVFFIHYKYSAILNITFVTMMYGMGLPLLFPVAALALFTLYVAEKILIHYSYRQPPMYDDQMNNNAIALLRFAPLLFLSFGYWMMSNKQLFSNDYLTEMEHSTDVKKTSHVWTEIFSARPYRLEPQMPLIIAFWFILLLTLLRERLYKYLGKLIPIFADKHIEIDEDLDNYFNTMDDHDRNWSIKEEDNARNVLKMKILDDYTLERLKQSQSGDTQMKGVHCYDILANPLYLDDFQYFSCSMEDREKYIIDDDDDEDNDNAQSDLVKVILNLAFLTQEQARNFKFSKDTYRAMLMGRITNKLGIRLTK